MNECSLLGTQHYLSMNPHAFQAMDLYPSPYSLTHFPTQWESEVRMMEPLTSLYSTYAAPAAFIHQHEQSPAFYSHSAYTPSIELDSHRQTQIYTDDPMDVCSIELQTTDNTLFFQSDFSMRPPPTLSSLSRTSGRERHNCPDCDNKFRSKQSMKGK